MTSDATKIGSQEKNNSIFVDLIEKMTCTFGSSGNVVNSFIDGTVVSKSYVEGSPVFKLLFCNNVYVGESTGYGGIKLSSVNFNSCVDFSSFEHNKSLTFVPPAGTCDLMYYRIEDDFNYPFKINTFFSEISNYKI